MNLLRVQHTYVWYNLCYKDCSAYEFDVRTQLDYILNQEE